MRSRRFEEVLELAIFIALHCQSLASSTHSRKYLCPGGRSVILRGTHADEAFDVNVIVARRKMPQ